MRLLSLIFLLPISISINAAPNIKTHKKNGLSVKVIEDNSGIPKTTIDKILDIFFSTYPKMAKEFRPTGFIKDFEFHFFPNITVSSSNGPRIRFYNKQFREDPNTLNTILHESFHSLQFKKVAKGKSGKDIYMTEGPNWLFEGMADYARDRFGDPKNDKNWKLAEFFTDSRLNYDSGYGATASFLKFVEKKKKGTAKKLFDELFASKYTEASWNKFTGKSAAQWWQEYKKASTAGKRTKVMRMKLQKQKPQVNKKPNTQNSEKPNKKPKKC